MIKQKKNYQLTYPEYKDLPKAKIAQVLWSGGYYNGWKNDTQQRLDENRLSKGDLLRMGIAIFPNDLKTILHCSPEFKASPILKFNGKRLVFKGEIQQLAFYPQALGIQPAELKKGDRVYLVELIDRGYKGKVPVLKNIPF